jgi:hypothetical protein
MIDKKTLRTALILARNRILFTFMVSKSNKIPRLILPEGWKPRIRWAVRIITAIGWISALITIDSKIVAVLVSIAFSAMIFLLDRNLFRCESLAIFPFPSFEIDHSRWDGMFFDAMPYNDARYPYVCLVFNDEEYLRNIHSYICTWTGGKT